MSERDGGLLFPNIPENRFKGLLRAASFFVDFCLSNMDTIPEDPDPDQEQDPYGLYQLLDLHKASVTISTNGLIEKIFARSLTLEDVADALNFHLIEDPRPEFILVRQYVDKSVSVRQKL